MAKIREGSEQADWRGKIGDKVYVKNKYGTYVKKYVMPSNPRTPAQLRQRKLFKETIQIINGLTQEEIKEYKVNAPNKGIMAWRKFAFNQIYTALKASNK